MVVPNLCTNPFFTIWQKFIVIYIDISRHFNTIMVYPVPRLPTGHAPLEKILRCTQKKGPHFGPQHIQCINRVLYKTSAIMTAREGIKPCASMKLFQTTVKIP